MTIALAWPKGTIIRPLFYRNQFINWLSLLGALGLPISVLIYSLGRWRRSGRDPKIKKTIIAQYQPPENLPPAIVGILMKQRFKTKLITATLIDLAVRGYLKIKAGNTFLKN